MQAEYFGTFKSPIIMWDCDGWLGWSWMIMDNGQVEYSGTFKTPITVWDCPGWLGWSWMIMDNGRTMGMGIIPDHSSIMLHHAGMFRTMLE